MKSVLVIAELAGGKLRKATHSAITFARQTGVPFSILVVGAGAGEAAKEAAAFGAQKVLVADDAAFGDVLAERYAPTIAAVAKSGGFDLVAVTASSFGKDLAP